MEIALDFAVQCAPDHPWVREHPEWFVFRPDGTIKYAENPPKKYQDIVNVDFDSKDRAGLWRELLETILFWAEQGVRIFRVDNPHTKPVPFWEWCIRNVTARYPDVIFLAEAFTRPKMMKLLAKAGFSQSYSYFTWRNTKDELTTYLTELTQGPEREFMQPNFFANTPDILPHFLQEGGRPAFRIRLALAATLSPSYGIYNGYELCEAAAVPDSEEYLHSEKYEYKVWDWDRPGNIKDEIAAVNRFRRANPAMRLFTNLVFCPTWDEHILAYVKLMPDGSNVVLVVVNLDPHATHEAALELPLQRMGFGPGDAMLLEEGIGGAQWVWRGAQQRIALDPAVQPAMVFRVTATGG
jgi:starch synthase (maltosyl-transferring)